MIIGYKYGIRVYHTELRNLIKAGNGWKISQRGIITKRPVNMLADSEDSKMLDINDTISSVDYAIEAEQFSIHTSNGIYFINTKGTHNKNTLWNKA